MAGMERDTPIPNEIKLHQKSRVLEIAFDDGKTFRLPYEFLRVHSPSAEVRGHVSRVEAREATLRTFVANTTHDVMLPLTVLQGHLAALQRALPRRVEALSCERGTLGLPRAYVYSSSRPFTLDVPPGSVVTKDIPSYSVAVGNPARVIKRYDAARAKWIRVDE